MKSNKGEIEEEQLEELNFWRLSKNSNLQITPISKPEPNEEDLKSASFAESGYTPNSLLDISQDKRLIAMGNTKGFSIFSTTELYSKLRQADGSVKQAYPSIWVHTRRGIPSHIKFLPDNERLLVVVRSYIQIYKISDILENNHDASPIKEVDFKCESITKLAINHSAQDIRILVVFDGESVQLLDQDLNYRLIDGLKGAAVGFVEGDEDHFCIGYEDGSIKKHKINGDEVFSFPLPVDIQATKAQLVEFQFVNSKYMVSLHYSSDEDAYWFTLSVVNDDEITYFSSDTLIWPPTEGSALDQQFYISEVPNVLPDDSQLFVLNFSCYDSSKYLKIDTKDGIQVTDISPNEKFAISHPVIEFNNDAESYPIGQILDLSVQGRIPNPGEDSDKNFSPRPILTVLNNYGQCYSYDVIYEPNLKDESYTYKMADSIDYFTESNRGELSNIIWGHEIPESGFQEALELSAPTTPISAVNELDQDSAGNTTDQVAPKLTSQLTKESDYSLVSSNDDIADLSQVSDPKAEANSTEKKHTVFESIKEETPIESAKQSQDKTKDITKESSKPDILPTKKEIPKVTPIFKASEPLEALKKHIPVANQEDSDEDEDEVEPVKLEFEWPSLPSYPARPESPKLKETKEQVTSMIINLFKDKFNDKLKSTRTSLNSSGEQIMNFRDSSLSSTVCIGESELQDVTQWKQCLDKLIEAVKLKKANSSEWINQVTDAYNGWKQLNSFNQHIKEIKEDGKDTQIQLHKLTPEQIRNYSKMSDWNQSCNHLVDQLEELFAKIGDTRSDYEKVPTLEQINTVMNSIESSIQTTKNSLTSQLVQIESLQSEIIQSNNKYLPHYFIPNQTSASPSSKESNLDSVQISEAGKKLAQQRKSKLVFNAQLLEVMQKHKPQWRKPMIKHSLVHPSISKQLPGNIKSHTFGSDELKDEMFASTNSLRQSSASQSVSTESI